tara:strand:- start:81892 stop:82407 length:516 start_codon:yes stop_codon:yes gene_type:complete
MRLLFEIWRQYIKENERRVVTFDFDDTISLSHYDPDSDFGWVYDGPHEMMIERAKKFIADPSITVYVVTSRFEKNEAQSRENPDQWAVKEFLDEKGIEVDGVYFTNGQPKIETLLKLGSVLHHDDDPGDILDARENDIEAFVSDPYGDYNNLEASELQLRNQNGMTAEGDV